MAALATGWPRNRAMSGVHGWGPARASPEPGQRGWRTRLRSAEGTQGAQAVIKPPAAICGSLGAAGSRKAPYRLATGPAGGAPAPCVAPHLLRRVVLCLASAGSLRAPAFRSRSVFPGNPTLTPHRRLPMNGCRRLASSKPIRRCLGWGACPLPVEGSSATDLSQARPHMRTTLQARDPLGLECVFRLKRGPGSVGRVAQW